MKKQILAYMAAAGVILLLAGCDQKKASEEKTSTAETITMTENAEIVETDTEKERGSASAENSGDDTSRKETASVQTETASQTQSQPETEEPADEELVRVQDYIPMIVVDLKYATEDNFTGTVIYDFTDAYLRYGTVKKLAEAEKEFESLGMRIKIWDAYRPVEAQEKLWEVYPDPVYVADPSYGITSHSRGDTIDCTLVYMDGSDVEMPTGFDDFSPMADRYYDDCSENAANNARLMEEIMYAHGFTGYEGEWWDFSDEYQYW